MRTNGLQLHVLAFDLMRPAASQAARVEIKDIGKIYEGRPESSDVSSNTIIVGIDPGEVVSASFCALDPKKPGGLKNLIIRRKALYGPTLKYRALIGQMRQKRPVRAVEDNHGNKVYVEIPSIDEQQTWLGSHPSEFSSVSKQRDIHNMWFVFDELRSFYGNHTYKKLAFDHSNAKKAELDLAVNSAFRMIGDIEGSHTKSNRPVIFVYGNGKFNTRTKLSSLHDSFRGYFYLKVM
jgi:hypothetical protein